MNFQEAEKRYAALREQLNQRQISEEQFAEQVFALRLQDAKGAWWQVNGADGSWLVWNGAAWQPAAPPQPTPAPQPKAKAPKQPAPAKPKSEGGGILGWFSQLGKGEKKPAAQAVTPQAQSPEAQMAALHQQVKQIIELRRKEGYVPTHPSVGANLWGSTLTAVMQAGVPGFTCGHCRNFAGWGIQWMWPVATQIFGEQVTVTEITCYRNEWISHQATRLILPDGQRYVIDFWEGLLFGEPRIYQENDWINHYRARVGGNAQILTMEGRS
jgi:hypothetical protein